MNGEASFSFTEKDFKAIVYLIYSRVGISLHESKKSLVYNRLVSRLRANNLQNFTQYIHLLEDEDAFEWRCFVNALTTNFTYFFREPYHFELLAEHVKSYYLSKQHLQPLLIWSSACSTGEEAYSIAMTMVEAFGTLNPPIKILATDLNSDVLSRAKKGVYGSEQLENVSDVQKKQFFLTTSKKTTFEIKPEIRALVSFKRLNLIDQKWPMTKYFDIIFCRNVLIYFDKNTQQKLLRKFATYQHKDALLFLGHSESFPSQQSEYKLIRKTMYIRV
jgi:chemotaxis protein methyltransferase CheR